MRSLGLIEGDSAIISPGLQLSGSLGECWRCESRCKLTPECLLSLTNPTLPPTVATFSIRLHLDFRVREKAILPKPRGQRGEGTSSSPLSAPFLIYFILWPSPLRCDTTSLWSLLPHTSLHFLLPISILFALILTPRVFSPPDKITKSTGRAANTENQSTTLG